MGLVKQVFAERDLRRRIANDRDRLYRMALSWCGDPMVADDLVQETLILALQRVSQLRDGNRLNAWLYRILSNNWNQHLRRTRPLLDVDDVALTASPDVETDCARRETVDLVRQCILKLPPGQRQTLTLVDLGGFSYAEVAEVLAIPLGTVMSRLHTARQLLHKDLIRVLASQPATSVSLRRIR